MHMEVKYQWEKTEKKEVDVHISVQVQHRTIRGSDIICSSGSSHIV